MALEQIKTSDKNPAGAYGQKNKLINEFVSDKVGDKLLPVTHPINCKGIGKLAFIVTNESSKDAVADIVVMMSDDPAAQGIKLEIEPDAVPSGYKTLAAQSMAFLKIEDAGLMCWLQLFAQAPEGKTVDLTVMVVGERLK